MDYLNKYKGQGERMSVYDILRLDANKQSDWENQIKPNYLADGIHEVVIGGNKFTNYGDFQFAWEKSYVKNPERAADGSIGNLNSYATFVTPHLILNFSVMSIDDYRKIMKMDLEQNEFVVECYDPINNTKFKGKMYFATPQMAKLLKIAKIRFDGESWDEFVELVGVEGYSVELIGTNADLSTVNVIYHLNPPASTGVADRSVGDYDIYSGEEVIIGGSASDITSETFGGKYKFKHWSATPTGDGGNYLDGYAYTIRDTTNLYAVWESVTSYTLSFNYGVADKDLVQDETRVQSRTVTNGKSIGVLPEVPYVEVEAGLLSPYINGAWYKTPVKAENSIPVYDREPYWLDRDGSLYLLYDLRSYDFVLKIYNDAKGYFELYQNNLAAYGNGVKYGSTLSMPVPVKDGYNFDGWYKTEDFRQDLKFNETAMPARNTTLYGRWIKQ